MITVTEVLIAIQDIINQDGDDVSDGEAVDQIQDYINEMLDKSVEKEPW